MQKISVEQKSGEIRISRGGDPPTIYPVKNGVVEVADDAVDGFLRQIPGSTLSADKADAGSPSKEV